MSIKENWVQAFPQSCAEDVQVVTRFLPRRWFRPTISGTFEIAYWQETLILPSRMYFDEVAEEKIHTSSQSQRWLLYCMYTRHHDGYVREKYVRLLEDEQATADWVLLYLLELTGEYVKEILQRIEPILHNWPEVRLRSFVEGHEVYLERIEQRIISYWNAYYRETNEQRKDSTYIGFRILHFLRTGMSLTV
ncbi:hypothetical protein [Exiguobacterium undae]|uniref:hypothetical protein n=1 Tax=Exiguobacterium undae TaxID=169177 RepID=UPI0006873D9C|nr:hypothetical protein [Exiguobacterium undae]